MNGTEAGKAYPWKWLGAGLLLLALLRLPSLDMPLDRDEGEYATLAWAWMRGLGIPYRDFLEQKPPLAVFAYMAAFFSGSFSAGAVRGFALFWQLLSGSALFALALRITQKPAAAALALALFACLSVSAYTQGLSANTELFATLPLIAAVAALQYGVERPHWVSAGIFIGLAGLAKQSALPAALLLPLLLKGDLSLRPRRLLWCLQGAALPWLLCLALFGLYGAAGDFWRCVFTYNLAYAGQGLGQQLKNLGHALSTLAREDWALWLALAFAAVSSWRGKSRGTRLAWIWLGSVFLGAMLSGRYYPHYFQPLAAPMALIAALWAFAPGGRWQRVLLLPAFALIFAARNAPLWAAPDGAQRSQRLYGLPNFAQAPRTAEALRARTPEGSRILIWGSEAELYFLSQRRPATRFLFHYPFTGEAPAWPGAGEEWLKAMEDPLSSAVVLAAPRDRQDPLQRKMDIILQRQYELHVDLAPDTLIGIRKGK